MRTLNVDLSKVEMGRPIRGEDVDVSDLVESLPRVGQLSPLLVIPKPGKPDHYLVQAGHRRYLAMQQLGWTKASISVLEGDAAKVESSAIYENLARQQLPPSVEARELARLKELHDLDGAPGGRFDQVAAVKTGLAERTIRRRVHVGQLAAPEVLTALDAGVVTLKEADKLASLPVQAQTEAVQAKREAPKPAKAPGAKKPAPKPAAREQLVPLTAKELRLMVDAIDTAETGEPSLMLQDQSALRAKLQAKLDELVP